MREGAREHEEAVRLIEGRDQNLRTTRHIMK